MGDEGFRILWDTVKEMICSEKLQTTLSWPHIGMTPVLPPGLMLGQHLTGSNFDEFMFSRVGVCGLEMLGRWNRDKEEIDRDME